MKEILDIFRKSFQGCLNTYNGKFGTVKNLLPNWEEHVIQNVEFYFATEGNHTGWGFFRGSDDPKDWWQNIDTHSIDVDNGQMHLGIHEDHIKVEQMWINFAKRFKRFRIAGHSKGAMQTTHMYHYLKRHLKFDDLKGIAIAPGKNVSKHFKEFYNDGNFFTFINGEDGVTKQPFWKFCHVGKIIHIGKRNLFWQIPVLRLLGAPNYFGLELKPRKDHYPQEYLKNYLKAEKMIKKLLAV